MNQHPAQHNVLIAAVLMLIATVVLWQYAPQSSKLDADSSIMIYAGQQILRGNPPYVSVAIVKLPLAPLVSAGGIAVGRVIGVDDILGGRFAFMLCAVLTVGLLFVVGTQLAGRIVGIFSGLILLGSEALGVQVTLGPEAKLPMVLCGMACLALIARRRWLWAGAAGALSFLAWQPGLIFVAGAVIALVAEKPERRKRAAAETVIGIAIPLVLVGTYLAFNGAFGAMWQQTFGANANYFANKKAGVGLGAVIADNGSRLLLLAGRCSPGEPLFVFLGWAGVLGGAAYWGWRLARGRDTNDFLNAFPLLLSGAGLFGFTLIDLQKCSDYAPLLPYFALGAGGLIYATAHRVMRYLADALHWDYARLWGGTAIVLCVLLLAYGAADALSQGRQDRLTPQLKLMNSIAARLDPGDRIQQFGDTVLLVVSHRENATKYVHLGEKQGLGILDVEGVDMPKLIAKLEEANPRLITLSRAKSKAWAAPLYEWIESHYDLTETYTGDEGGTVHDTDVYWRK